MTLYKNNKKKALRLLLLIFCITIVISLLILFKEHKPSSITMTISRNGFSPNTVTIPLGTIVKFDNIDTTEHWPASDNHPLHEIYPQFDSKQPISQKQSWSFTFDKAGTFPFHDHLNPKIHGTIIVSSVMGIGAPAQYASNDPRNIIKQQVKQKGPLEAWNFFQKNYSNATFGAHDIAHYLGLMLYEKYQLDALQYCNSNYAFGCYHGLIEGYIKKNGLNTLDQVIDKCKQISSKDEENSCYHGMGHGIISSYQYDLNPSLQLCDQLLKKPEILNCYTGVFMDFATTKSNTTQQDPFYPCSIIKDQYMISCLEYQISFLNSYFKSDNRKISEACLSLKKDEYIDACLRGQGHRIAQQYLTQPNLIKQTCESVKSEAITPCILYAAQEFVFQDQQYDIAKLTFCDPLDKVGNQRCMAFIDQQKNNHLNNPL